MRLRTFIITFLLIILESNAQILSDSVSGRGKTIYRFQLFEEIAPQATRKTSRAIDEAVAMKADLIILHMNTYGGLVSDADSIRTRLLNSPIPVYVFVENNAASAGALIAIACNRIFMREGSSIGAATVVTGDGSAAPDKYQSYMRSKMRATATARGRSPEIAEAMVDGDKVVPGLNDTGDVVTLTTDEAIKWGFCNAKYTSIEATLRE
ncbi:MAG: nodulation protein NfeD, partial [Bacteroidota bacterium]|nr:nodulation protein NfeD [Bacteroidota bacterium]MDX5430123.1 nodulation protein NfeD [Bacteroidota bacterium]MDX5468884.1 nodulation protein NfeD [Bacteroidota bacterium]